MNDFELSNNFAGTTIEADDPTRKLKAIFALEDSGMYLCGKKFLVSRNGNSKSLFVVLKMPKIIQIDFERFFNLALYHPNQIAIEKHIVPNEYEDVRLSIQQLLEIMSSLRLEIKFKGSYGTYYAKTTIKHDGDFSFCELLLYKDNPGKPLDFKDLPKELIGMEYPKPVQKTSLDIDNMLPQLGSK